MTVVPSWGWGHSLRRWVGLGLVCALSPCRATAFPGTAIELPLSLKSPGSQDVPAREPPAESTALLKLSAGLEAGRAGDFERASLLLGQASGTHIDDLAAFHRAEALFHQGRYGEAEAAYGSLVKAFPQSAWRHRSTFRIGDCQAGAGNAAAAITTWTRALLAYPEYPARAALRFALAQAEATRGRLDYAAAWYRELLKLDPGDPLAKNATAALSDLERHGVHPVHPDPAERLRQALDLRQRKYYDGALAALGAMRAETDLPVKIRAEVEWNTARSLWDSERFPEALAAFRAIRDAAKTDAGRRRRATRWVGYSLERLGELDAAAAALVEAGGRPDHPAPEVSEDVAWLYFNGGAYAKAEPWFKRLPASVHGLRFMGAWLTYRRGEFKKAAEQFGQIARTTHIARDRFLYWQARSLAAGGDKPTATGILKQVVELSPIGYYGYQAGARLAEWGGTPAETPGTAAPSPTLADLVTEPPLPLLQTLSDRWGDLFPALASALELEAVGEQRLAALRLREVSDELRAFRTGGRGRNLRRWTFVPRPYLDNRETGATGEWGRTLSDAVPPPDPRRGPAIASTSGELYELLSRAFVAVDDPHYARRHLHNTGPLRPPPEAAENRSTWARYFPRAFADVLVGKAAHYGVEPELLWAFMTVESSYNPFAISRANARGLMQVMPQTGGLIADRMALRGFGAALLFEPEITLEMAAWYVRALLDKFNGQSPLAIAAYNAGPHRVAAWLKRKGGLPMDEFIEEIPYDEAREYTKKVIRFWGLYRRIYKGRAGLELGGNVNADFKANINF